MADFIRALAIGDIHGSLKYLDPLRRIMEKYEYIFVLGDISFDRNYGFFIKIINELFTSLKNKVFIVRGENDPEKGLDNVKKKFIFERTYIDDKLAVVAIPPLISYDLLTPLETEIAKFEHEVCNIRKEVEMLIMVTHIPPYGLKVDYNPVKGFMGSYALRRIIEKCQPTLTLCAHAHEGRNIVKYGETLIMNPGPLRRGFYGELYIRINNKPKLFSVVLSRF